MAWNWRTILERAALATLLTTSAVIGAGCGDEEQGGDALTGHDFVSDRPGGNNYSSGAGEDAGGDTSSGTSGAGGSGGNVAPDDPEREIIEADIIQVQDNRLFALSQYGGLSIIDISQPDNLALEGRYTVKGTPFEMYLQDNLVFAMFTDWGEYVWDEGYDSYQWVSTSRIEVIDVSNPAAPTQLGEFDLPGYISDSRIVGDVLYAVTFEDGYCYGCGQSPNTTITALNIGTPGAIGIVDQLTYTNPDPYSYGWWRRSIHVTEERIYVGGVEWDGQGAGHSTIQVVDISAPNGILVEGATVEAAGQIESRWQMDELDGVLRVISQPGMWETDAPPVVQTFTVLSSDDVQPLATMSLTLPMPERLRSVRFDGPKAYAITAVQEDPLFIIDLADPALPLQRGMLEMPGWVYHMEPRGDRVYALGFDNTNPEGNLAVSLFDVADMDNPTMLQRVGFGGEWSSVPEDQDRIHKAFKFVDELGLLLVPYSSWTSDGAGYECGYTYESGIQLIDYTADTLDARGLAEVSGWARRAFVANGKLFSVSDADVRAFDIADRDAPAQEDLITLSVNVEQALIVGNNVARIATDWWSGGARLEMAPLADPGKAEPLGVLDLGTLDETDTCGWSYYGAKAFANGNHVYLVRSGWDTKTHIDVIDVSNPAAPTVVGQLTVPFPTDVYGYWGGINAAGQTLVQLGSTLVAQRVPYDEIVYDENYWTQSQNAYLEIFDLSDPAAPAHAKTVNLPSGQGHTPLLVEGTDILTSHWVPLANDPEKIKFYVDRIPVASPASASVTSSINVPGSLLAVDGASNHVLTMDYEANTVNNVTWEDCYSSFGWDTQFEYYDYSGNDPHGDCTWFERSLNLVALASSYATLLDSSDLTQGTYVSRVFTGLDRVFVETSYSNYDYDTGAGNYWNGFTVVGDLGGTALERAEFQFDPNQYAYAVGTSDKRLVLASYYPTAIAVLDATDLSALSYEVKGELPSYTWNVTISGDLALCAMGYWGVEAVSLE
jgi:hypothetical protein